MNAPKIHQLLTVTFAQARERTQAELAVFLADAVEALVDNADTHQVAEALAAVCWSKAGHVEEAWQDTNLANAWERAGMVFDRAASELRRRDLVLP